ncbi:BamA/TamA family outer membrane protein [Flavobacterium rhizosphaerae]|uniref:Outer membrane protein assembly factor BamA n=1 Tax=Flavobacterium rhizosphaerae TaxID=3163298 RepID=A0ABW8YZR2_9FLAO
MKKILLLVVILCAAFSAGAQNFYLKATGRNEAETKIIDSVSYKNPNPNARAVTDEANALSAALYREGYLENRIADHIKVNDSVFNYMFYVGNKTNTLYIYTGNLSESQKLLLEMKPENDTLAIPFNTAEEFMNGNLGLLEQKGYSFSALRLTGYQKKGNALYAALLLETSKKRTLNNLVLEGYDKFPEGIRRNILRQYRGKTFNQKMLEKVYSDFNALQFVSQPRYPEILFKEDSTTVYVYLEKAHPNTFDGFIGFTNDDENKIRFNGYTEILLNNILNSGEKFNLYWKSNGNGQTTFNTSLELPYIFKTPLGVKGSLQIFKQDSTFQNTVSDINLGYYFNYNSKVFLGYRKTQSTDIQNLDSSTLSDFSNTFYTASYFFTRYGGNRLFPVKSVLEFAGGTGSRNNKGNNTGQYFVQAKLSHNFYLNETNIINLKSENYYLKSENYIVNELYRFGGINSIRGFNENSLQANIYSAILSEYRYMLSPGLYAHTITDYGYYQDQANNVRQNLLGIGFGLGLYAGGGLFNIVYANGSTKGQTIKLSNSIVHISYKASF